MSHRSFPDSAGTIGTRNATLLAAALFLVGFVGYTLRATEYFQAVPGDLGDARFNSVILEHLYLWVVGQQAHLWSPDFFYPNPGALTFSDNHLGTAVFYLPFRILGLSREIAFDIWFSLGFALNFTACFVALRRLQFGRFPAAAGAFVFTFALPMLTQEGHAQLLYRFAVPLAVLALIEAWQERRATLLWRVVFWTVVQFFCTIYIGVFLLYLLSATAVALFVSGRPGTLSDLCSSLVKEPRQRLLSAGIVVAISLAALAWLLYPYLYFSQVYGFRRPNSEIATMLPRIGSYLLGDRSPYTAFLGSWLDGIPMRHEHQMFIGVGALALCMAGLIPVGRKTLSADKLLIGRMAILSFSVLFVVTLNIGGVSLYKLLINVPGINAVRAISRIILVMLFPIAILSAVGVEWLMSRIAKISSGVVWPAGLGIVALLGFEAVTFSKLSRPIAAWRERLEVVRRNLPAPLAGNSILWLRGTNGPDYKTSLDAMMFAQDSRVPTLNGYSGNSPPYTLQPAACVTPAAQLAAWANFNRMPVDRQEALLQRTVTANLSPCTTGDLMIRDRPLGREVARQIELSIASAQQSGDRIRAVVALRNRGPDRFDTVSRDGRNVRLSWRVVPLSREPQPTKDQGWDTRRELGASLAPDASIEIAVEVAIPAEPGDYALEFSLVEELVRWFHNDGLVPPRHLFRVPH